MALGFQALLLSFPGSKLLLFSWYIDIDVLEWEHDNQQEKQKQPENVLQNFTKSMRLKLC